MPGDELARPRLVEGVEMLLDQEVRDARRELQADRSRDRPAALMRRDIAAMRERQIRHGQRVGDAAERHRLGLEDVDAAALRQREELPDRVVHLAGRDRDRACRRDRMHRLLPVARRRLLPPVDAERRHAARDAQRLALGEARVHVDQDQRVARQLLPQRAEDLVGELQLVLADETLRVAERIELESLEALCRAPCAQRRGTSPASAPSDTSRWRSRARCRGRGRRAADAPARRAISRECPSTPPRPRRWRCDGCARRRARRCRASSSPAHSRGADPRQ